MLVLIGSFALAIIVLLLGIQELLKEEMTKFPQNRYSLKQYEIKSKIHR